MTTCDDRRMPRPATGKTPVRNVRIPDEIWLPALARAEALGSTATDAVEAGLRWYAPEPLPAAHEFTFANWPEGERWARGRAAALGALCADLATSWVILPVDWLAIAAWLPSTHHEGDPVQQKRVIAGHVLRYLMASDWGGGWRDKYRDSRHLSETVQAILERHLPLGDG
jgi:hypothetical protein